MSSILFINAINIHAGGGKALLDSILGALPQHQRAILLVDSRVRESINIPKHIIVRFVSGTIISRLRSEYWIYCNSVDSDIVLCFGNLPPLFKLGGRVVVYIQNRYLIEKVSLVGFSLLVRIRIFIERLWLKIRIKDVDLFVVQTFSMKNILEFLVKAATPVIMLPFVKDPMNYSRGLISKQKSDQLNYDFIYIASGEPHKNHRNLLVAWELLAIEGIFPSLGLTLDEVKSSLVCELINNSKRKYGLKIHNLGAVDYRTVLSLYHDSKAAIYPSKLESLGLPLIEARQAGLPILASELDYVRDVVDPEEVFDPESPKSIARAVKRFMGIEEKSLHLLNAEQFLEKIFQKDVL